MMEHQQIITNGINLHVVQDGARAGQLVILLHGFPEFWYGWRRQIPYLAAAGYRVWAPANPRIRVPTLLIWGTQDRYLGREMAQPSIDLCDDGRLVFIEGATHWVQHEEADRVNSLIDGFLRGDSKS
jgi:pimeloyl-ACP methyl ester carboxylesterase